MNKDNINQDDNSNEDIFLSLIDEKRNKDTEIRFSLYIKKCYNFDEEGYSKNNEKENNEDINEHQPQAINVIIGIKINIINKNNIIINSDILINYLIV